MRRQQLTQNKKLKFNFAYILRGETGRCERSRLVCGECSESDTHTWWYMRTLDLCAVNLATRNIQILRTAKHASTNFAGLKDCTRQQKQHKNQSNQIIQIVGTRGAQRKTHINAKFLVGRIYALNGNRIASKCTHISRTGISERSGTALCALRAKLTSDYLCIHCVIIETLADEIA